MTFEPKIYILFLKMERIKLFLQESRKEFNRVNWPTAGETVRLTGIVVVMSLITAAFLGFFDLAFLYGLENILQ